MHCTAQVWQVRSVCEPLMQDVWLATTVLYSCVIGSFSARRAQERIAELQYELEVSRDREVVTHDQLSRLTVQVCVEERGVWGMSVVTDVFHSLTG